MEKDLQQSLTELTGKLDNIFDHVKSIEIDVKELTGKVEKMNVTLSNHERLLGRLEKDIEYAEKDRVNIKTESQSIWNQFKNVEDSCRIKHLDLGISLTKEKDDLKDYIKDRVKESADMNYIKIQNWIYGLLAGTIGLIIFEIIKAVFK